MPKDPTTFVTPRIDAQIREPQKTQVLEFESTFELASGEIMIDVAKKEADRFRFLRALYELVDGDAGPIAETRHIAKSLGMDGRLVGQVVTFLMNEGLIEGWGEDRYAITHAGVRQIEEALRNPSQATRYFPPLNVITINGDVYGSTIQQAGNHSNQTATINASDIRAFLEELKTKLSDLGLSDSEKSDLGADIQTVEVQLQKSSPLQSVIKGTLLSIKAVLEAAMATAVSSGLLQLLAPLLAG